MPDGRQAFIAIMAVMKSTPEIAATAAERMA
jgi:hypothetical protein